MWSLSVFLSKMSIVCPFSNWVICLMWEFFIYSGYHSWHMIYKYFLRLIYSLSYLHFLNMQEPWVLCFSQNPSCLLKLEKNPATHPQGTVNFLKRLDPLVLFSASCAALCCSFPTLKCSFSGNHSLLVTGKRGQSKGDCFQPDLKNIFPVLPLFWWLQ